MNDVTPGDEWRQTVLETSGTVKGSNLPLMLRKNGLAFSFIDMDHAAEKMVVVHCFEFHRLVIEPSVAEHGESVRFENGTRKDGESVVHIAFQVVLSLYVG